MFSTFSHRQGQEEFYEKQVWRVGPWVILVQQDIFRLHKAIQVEGSWCPQPRLSHLLGFQEGTRARGGSRVGAVMIHRELSVQEANNKEK